MVNETMPHLISNISYWIGQNVIGAGTTSDYTVGYMLIGAVIVLTFLIYIWNARIGMFGAIVVMPPLLIVLGSANYIPAWLSTGMWIGLGFVIGMIMLEMWRENR